MFYERDSMWEELEYILRHWDELSEGEREEIVQLVKEMVGEAC